MIFSYLSAISLPYARVTYFIDHKEFVSAHLEYLRSKRYSLLST